MPFTLPTSTARWIEWIESNFAASSPIFSERTVSSSVVSSARRRRVSAASEQSSMRSSSATIRASDRVATFTSRVNTTPAAALPPMTDACAPSTAIASKPGFRRCEKTTNAPPW
jgi:hypothetical protein